MAKEPRGILTRYSVSDFSVHVLVRVVGNEGANDVVSLILRQDNMIGGQLEHRVVVIDICDTYHHSCRVIAHRVTIIYRISCKGAHRGHLVALVDKHTFE